jgi:hypothetical protein
MPSIINPTYYEHAKGDAADNATRTDFFRHLCDGDWVIRDDTGSTESPLGWVALVEVTDEDVSRWVNGEIDGDLHLEIDNVEAGWYVVRRDDNGLVWAMTYGTGTLAEEGARADYAEAEAVSLAWDRAEDGIYGDDED